MTLAAKKLLATLCCALLPAMATADSPAGASSAGGATDKQSRPNQVSVVPWRSQRFGDYQALLIGIDSYSQLPRQHQLTTAINDAKAVAQLLREKYGFNVRTVGNATRATIFAELLRLREQLRANDRLLLYYSGRCHVEQANKQGYWWASDTNPAEQTSWIATAEVSDQLKAMKATQILVVADSCYTGVLPYHAQSARKQSESRDGWLQRLSQKRSRTVLTSGTLEPVADPAGAGHSLFADAFLKALRENNAVIDGATLFATLKPAAPAGVPAYSLIEAADDKDGDFVFVPRVR
jgi:uncharacterized caspase-like protein